MKSPTTSKPVKKRNPKNSDATAAINVLLLLWASKLQDHRHHLMAVTCDEKTFLLVCFANVLAAVIQSPERLWG
jgi:hypothetical protein